MVRTDGWIRGFLAAVLCFFCWPVGAESALPLMRISLENQPDHVHTRAVRRFAEAFAEKTRGRLQVVCYDSARLYRDAQVLSAMAGDRLEMAVPGIWHFDRYVPDVGIFLLPAFYGRSPEALHAVSDGEVGAAVAAAIEEGLSAVVPGRWLDLGHAHVYALRPIRSSEDMRGLRIRVAGGLGNVLRIEAFGASALTVAWPDLSARLRQGDIGAVLTTHETVRSARLWETGLRHVFEDRQYFPQYIPLVRRSFWRRLSPDLQVLLRDTWEMHVDVARREAVEAQKAARGVLLEAGMEIQSPAGAELKKNRALLKAAEGEMLRRLGVSPELYGRAQKVLEAQDSPMNPGEEKGGTGP